MKQVIDQKLNRNTSWISWLASLSIIGYVSFLIYPRLINPAKTKKTLVNTIEVKTGQVEDIVNESGIVKLEGQQTLKSPVDGTVADVLIKTGDRFSSGEKLILLVDPQRETSTYEQNLNLQKKKLALATKIREVESAQIDLRLKQNKLKTELQLFEKGFISENELQTQQEQIRQAKSKLVQAQQGMKSAQLDLQLQELETTKKLAEQQKNLIAAPVSGKILQVDVKRGDVVQLGDSLVTIGNPQSQIVKLQISTLNATKVKLGQLARVSKIGPKSQIYTGSVESLSLIASTENNSGNNNSSVPTVSATVKLDTSSPELIPGSQVSVDIVLFQEKDTVILPTNAVVQNQGPPFVWIENSQGKVTKQPINLGLEGITSVQIKSGLKPGERVILPSPNIILQPGMTVRSSK